MSTRHNAKLLQQLNSDLTRTINWNKDESKVLGEWQNPYLDYLVDPSFEWLNGFFVLSFSDSTVRTGYTRCFPPNVEIIDCNVMIDGQNFFDQPVKDNLKTYDNIWKIPTGQVDGCTTCCSQDYLYLKDYYKMIAIDSNNKNLM